MLTRLERSFGAKNGFFFGFGMDGDCSFFRLVFFSLRQIGGCFFTVIGAAQFFIAAPLDPRRFPHCCQKANLFYAGPIEKHAPLVGLWIPSLDPLGDPRLPDVDLDQALPPPTRGLLRLLLLSSSLLLTTTVLLPP